MDGRQEPAASARPTITIDADRAIDSKSVKADEDVQDFSVPSVLQADSSPYQDSQQSRREPALRAMLASPQNCFGPPLLLSEEACQY
jgi:hypothetical protein